MKKLYKKLFIAGTALCIITCSCACLCFSGISESSKQPAPQDTLATSSYNTDLLGDEHSDKGKIRIAVGTLIRKLCTLSNIPVDKTIKLSELIQKSRVSTEDMSRLTDFPGLQIFSHEIFFMGDNHLLKIRVGTHEDSRTYYLVMPEEGISVNDLSLTIFDEDEFAEFREYISGAKEIVGDSLRGIAARKGRAIWQALKSGNAADVADNVLERDRLPLPMEFGGQIYIGGVTIIIPLDMPVMPALMPPVLRRAAEIRGLEHVERFENNLYFFPGRIDQKALTPGAGKIKLYTFPEQKRQQIKEYLLTLQENAAAEYKPFFEVAPSASTLGSGYWMSFYGEMERRFPKAYHFNQQAHEYLADRIIQRIRKEFILSGKREFRVLHAGSADGKLLRLLREKIKEELPDVKFHLFGVDMNAHLLSGRIDQEDLTIVRGSAADLSCLGDENKDNSFDIVIDYGLTTRGALDQKEDVEKALLEWKRVMKRGAIMYAVPFAPSVVSEDFLKKEGFMVTSRFLIEHVFDRVKPVVFYSYVLSEESPYEISDLEEDAARAGRSLPTNIHDGKYDLLVDYSMHRNDEEAEKDRKGWPRRDGSRFGIANRFNLRRVNTSDVDNILAHVKDPSRTIVQVAKDIPGEQIQRLKKEAPGIRIMRIDTADNVLLQDDERKDYRFNVYAMMLAARRIEEKDILEKNSLYRVLRFFIGMHSIGEKPMDINSYIEDLARGELEKIVLYNLSFRPAVEFDKPDYHNIAIVLISA